MRIISSILTNYFFKILWLCLVLIKLEGKCKGNKVGKKNEKKEKVEKKILKFKEFFLFATSNSIHFILTCWYKY